MQRSVMGGFSLVLLMACGGGRPDGNEIQEGQVLITASASASGRSLPNDGVTGADMILIEGSMLDPFGVATSSYSWDGGPFIDLPLGPTGAFQLSLPMAEDENKIVFQATSSVGDSLLARQLNRYYKEFDSLFSSKQTNIVDNESEDDALKRIVYCMDNPVADGIEREGKDHKGMRMRWPQPERVIKRPVGFFRTAEQGGKMPDEVVLRFTRPPGFEGLSDEELDLLIENRVLAYEQTARDGRCDVTDERPDPRSYPKSRHRLFQLAPLIGAAVKEQRLAAIARLRKFRDDHRDATLRKKNGEHDVIFPYGTNLAVARWNVMVEPAPT